MQKLIDAIVAWITSFFPPPKPADVIPIKPAPITPQPPVSLPIGTIGRPSDLPQSNHYASTSLELLAKEYNYLWPLISISSYAGDVADFAKSATTNRSRYQTVANAIGCPWWFVAVIHYREASLDWSANLANGDPFDKRTVNYPEGRGPFNSWEAAAIDALTFEGYAGKADWSFAMCLYRLEAYNGFGYRLGGIKDFMCRKQGSRVGTWDYIYHGSMQDTTPRNASPYMYCGTQFYEKGVSIEDHSFYPNAVDDQPGCFILIKALENLGERIS